MNLKTEIERLENEKHDYGHSQVEKEDELNELQQQKEEFECRLDESENAVKHLTSKLGELTERVKVSEKQRKSFNDAQVGLKQNLKLTESEREELLKIVNEKNNILDNQKDRIQEKEFNLSRLNDSSSIDEETISHRTNDSSRSAGSSRFSSMKQSDNIFEDDEDLKQYQWKVEEIPEEADEASSVGGDDVTPRRLEEDQEELA